MKKSIFIVAALAISLGLGSCQNESNSEITTDIVKNPNTASDESPEIEMAGIDFTESLFEFGDITQGEKVEHIFTFKNTGEAELVISTAKGSCGCTVPQWPKEPIAPGETGEIKVVFNSSGKSGKQHKKVSIVANTQPSTTTLAISGNVIAPKTEN